jgi:hypothetical protein
MSKPKPPGTPNSGRPVFGELTAAESNLIAMMEMWNERDMCQIRRRLEAIMDPHVEFCDPLHHIHGLDAFEAMVRKFREDYPRAELSRTTKIDHHHDRYRYEWLIVQDGKTVIPGFDVAQIDPDGKIKRIDGFFGPLKKL